MVHRKIRCLLLLVHACVRSRSCRGRRLAVYRTGRISNADQALRRSPDSSRTPSDHVFRVRHYRRQCSGCIHLTRRQPAGIDFLLRHEHPGESGHQQASLPRDRRDSDRRTSCGSGRRRASRCELTARIRKRGMVGAQNCRHDYSYTALYYRSVGLGQWPLDLVGSLPQHQRSTTDRRAHRRIHLLSDCLLTRCTSQRRFTESLSADRYEVDCRECPV